jgi:hypothetical protein
MGAVSNLGASMNARRIPVLIGALLAGWTLLTHAQHAHDPASHGQPPAASSAGPDKRILVKFPAQLRQHTLANMRDHLLALQQIQDALAAGRFDEAADVAEQRLGMTSLKLHGAHEVARYMPTGMQEAGTAMHRSASQFALAARDGAVTGDVKPPLGALAKLTANCVACHSAYGFK